MKRILIILLLMTANVVGRGQGQGCGVVLNHLLITVDSVTYQAIKHSDIVNSDFAFAYERNKNWEGLYLIGQDNYIEVFHPNSVQDEIIPVGYTWICQTSMSVNCAQSIKLPNNPQISYSSNDDFDELSVDTKDSSNLFTTREMNKLQYESWTKKTFSDSVRLETTDYNSPAESDSSKSYLFNNITGIELKVSTADSLSITQYLELIGYTVESKGVSNVKYSNSVDYIDLHFQDSLAVATVSVIHFKLNRSQDSKRISVGSTEVVFEGTKGRWVIEKTD